MVAFGTKEEFKIREDSQINFCPETSFLWDPLPPFPKTRIFSNEIGLVAISPHIKSVQYCEGCSVHWRFFSTSGDNISAAGG